MTHSAARAAPNGALPNTQALPIPKPAPVALNVQTPIPGNGAVLIQTMVGASTIVQLTHSSTSSALIEGELSSIGPLWIWKPLSPLAPGRYGLTLVNPSTGDIQPAGSSSYVVTVIDSWTAQVPPLTSMPSARAVDEPVEHACCRFLSGDALVDGTVCATTHATSRALVKPGLASAAPLEQLNQFLYRVRPAGSTPDPEPTGFMLATADFGALFDTQAEQYCFAVDAIDIVSHEIHAGVAVEPSCVAHGALPSFTSHAVEVPDAALHRSVCGAPPLGFETRWCELNANDCEATSFSCPLFGHICRGEALPPSSIPPALSGGTGGASGMSGHEPTPTSEAWQGSSGCSVAARSAPATTGVAWVLIACALCAGVRRWMRR
jgi:hypothetical protein